MVSIIQNRWQFCGGRLEQSQRIIPAAGYEYRGEHTHGVMMVRKSLGKIGERAAANYLSCQGYVIRERNWRYKRAEIDLICSKHQLLVFIEVKSRYCFKPGCSEFEVSREQMGRISWAAQRYMESAEHRWSVRFDLICVEVLNHREYQVNHYEDAFFPGLESTFY